MYRKFIIVLILTFVLTRIFGKDANISKQRIIVIDAGHGGKDSGALGSISKEKDIVLAISLKVGKYIEQNMPDVKVIYTRKTDIFIPLRERAMIANNNNADLFISIHANSNVKTTPSGTETYAMGLHKTKGNLEVAKKENSVIVYEEDYNVKYEGFDPNSSESYIIFSLMQNTYLEQSLNLASYVQDELHNRAKRINRGVKQAGFLVLWNTSMPSILIETGFVSNKKEEQYLTSEQGQDYLSSAIYRAVKKYFVELDKDDENDETSTTTATTPNTTGDYDKNNDKNPIVKDTKIIEEKETNTQSDNIIFRVQITSSSKPIQKKHPVFKTYNDSFEYIENNTYKYALGNFKNYKDVKSFQNQVKKDFPGAFVVAFKNDKKISLSEALKN